MACRSESVVTVPQGFENIGVLGFSSADDHTPCALVWSSRSFDAAEFPQQAPSDLDLVIVAMDAPFESLRAAAADEMELVPTLMMRIGSSSTATTVKLPRLARGPIVPDAVCQACGNGRPDAFKSCDDSNTVSGDGCSARCRAEPGWDCPRSGACEGFCGNARVDTGLNETCDGSVPSGATCEDALGFFGVGRVTLCNADCSLDTSDCRRCPDIATCDPDGAPVACGTVIPGAMGMIGCDLASCRILTTSCDPPTFDGDTRALDPGASWPMLGRGPTHQARAAAKGPVVYTLPRIAFAGTVVHSPTIGADGSVFFTTGDGNLSAVTSTGATKWSVVVGGPRVVSDGPAAVIADGVIYVGGDRLWARAPDDGSRVWDYETLSYVHGVTVGGDGTVYAATDDGWVYGVDPSVRPIMPRWSRQVGPTVFTPTIGLDGSVYVCRTNPANQPELLALTSTLAVRWAAPLPAGCENTSVAVDGTIYVGTGNNELRAINPRDGKERWVIDIGGYPNGFDSVPAISADGTIVIATRAMGVTAFNKAGRQVWRFGESSGGTNGIAIDGAGVVYISGWMPGSLIAVSPLGRLLWHYDAPTNCFGAAAIAGDGTVYMGCEDGLYAFSP